ncbi:MAG: hypothetical protein JWP87_1635 [Labilithrix sp.]|nr:hypothetical protein [Labilithrix sp.]
MHNALTRVRYLGLGLALLAGCSSSNDDGAANASSVPGGPVVSSATYDLRTDVTKLDAPAWDAMVLPHEGRNVWLKLDARGADWLKTGTVVVIKGRGVLKVGEVKEDGDHLVVERVPFDFGEFIENGTIEIKGATTFDAPFEDDPSELDVRSNGASPTEDETPPPAGAAPANGPAPQSRPLALRPLAGGFGKNLLDSVKNLATDGWQVEKKISGDGNALHYDITLTKGSGALYAKLHAVGTMNNLQTAFSVAVQNRVSQPETFDVHTSGDADLSWEVGISEGSVGYNKILLPGISYKQAFFAGEVPMVLKVKSGFALIVGATGKNTTSTGKVHVTYSSDGGVQVTSGSGDSNASGSGDTAYADDKGTLAVGPSAFGFVATLPKVELGVGLDSLFVAGTYFSNTSTTIVKSRGGIAGDPCSDIDMKFEGTVGLFVDGGLAGTLLTKGVEKTGNNLSKKLYDVNRKAATCGLK